MEKTTKRSYGACSRAAGPFHLSAPENGNQTLQNQMEYTKNKLYNPAITNLILFSKLKAGVSTLTPTVPTISIDK